MKKQMQPISYKTTNYLITLNGTILIGYFTIFQVSVSKGPQKWLLLASFLGLCFSMTLLVWYRVRWPKRDTIHNNLMEKSINQSVGNVMEFMEGLIRPLAQARGRLDVQRALETVSSKEEFEKLHKSIHDGTFEPKRDAEDEVNAEKEDKATRTVIASMIENLSHKSKKDFDIAYRKPLKESYAKLKYRIDMVASKFRIHIFIGSTVILAFSIIVAILQMPQV